MIYRIVVAQLRYELTRPPHQDIEILEVEGTNKQHLDILKRKLEDDDPFADLSYDNNDCIGTVAVDTHNNVVSLIAPGQSHSYELEDPDSLTSIIELARGLITKHKTQH